MASRILYPLLFLLLTLSCKNLFSDGEFNGKLGKEKITISAHRGSLYYGHAIFANKKYRLDILRFHHLNNECDGKKYSFNNKSRIGYDAILLEMKKQDYNLSGKKSKLVLNIKCEKLFGKRRRFTGFLKARIFSQKFKKYKRLNGKFNRTFLSFD